LALSQGFEEIRVAGGSFSRPADVFNQHAFGSIHGYQLQKRKRHNTATVKLSLEMSFQRACQRHCCVATKPYELLSMKRFRQSRHKKMPLFRAAFFFVDKRFLRCL
jgi:hypothetical protein